MYHLPLLPGYGPGSNIRSSAPPSTPGNEDPSSGLSEAEEEGYQGGYFTSIDPSTSRAVGAAVSAAGQGTFADAPMSGGVVGATAGTLTFMVGGDAADLGRARRILESMGANICHAGGPGNGQATKICNNLLAAISMIGVSEAYTLAQRLGLDPAVMRDIVATAKGPGGRPPAQRPEHGARGR